MLLDLATQLGTNTEKNMSAAKKRSGASCKLLNYLINVLLHPVLN